jgi:hypothetical protein
MTQIKKQGKSDPITIEDSIIAGILLAKNHKITPYLDEKKRVHYAVSGDVEKSLKEIYLNMPVGSLDVLNSIKTTRSMIFNLKAGGQR